MKKLVALALPVFVSLLSAPALAAPSADLGVSITPASGAHVYESGTYSFKVSNTGNLNAANVLLTVQLPETNTSPTVHVMGTFSGVSPSCSLSGTMLTCSLGTINKNKNKSISFDIALPYSAEPLVFDADASTTSAETNLANNSLTYVAAPLTYDVAVDAPVSAGNNHCTGTGLSSYFECELYPSSLSGFSSVLEADGNITIVDAPPGTTGEWTQTASDALFIQYFDGGTLIGTLDARGVSADCFEGPMTFPGSSYMAMYQVCLQ